MNISQKSAQQSPEAVLFFEEGAIAREMLYSEFEALLDGVVPVHGLAGRELQAAYVRLDAGLQPAVVVLFLIPFDQDGFPEQRWNLPLRQLAEASLPVPEPWARGIRLACRSRCPLPGWERGLWEPGPGVLGNTVEGIRARLGMNRLGLDAGSRGGSPTLTDTAFSAAAVPVTSELPVQAERGSSAADQDAMFAVMKQSNLQMSLLREQSQREVGALQQRLEELRLRCEQLESLKQQALSEAERASAESGVEIETLRTQCDAQTAEILRLQEAERTLQQALAVSEESSAAARDTLQTELARQEEKVQSLSAELTLLRRDKLRLMDDGADAFFAALRNKNVSFVSFQPGAGHITIPVDDLGPFLENTEDYVAAKCKVTPEHYRRWLLHYANPVCQGTSGSGAPCARPVTKVLKPAEFTAGLHDRCDIHKQVPRSQTLRERAP